MYLDICVREAGLEPARPKTQVPKTCVSAISPLPLKSVYLAVLVRFSPNAVR
jgi:hypothetical protein